MCVVGALESACASLLPELAPVEFAERAFCAACGRQWPGICLKRFLCCLPKAVAGHVLKRDSRAVGS